MKPLHIALMLALLAAAFIFAAELVTPNDIRRWWDRLPWPRERYEDPPLYQQSAP